MGGLAATGDDAWADVLAANVIGTMHVVSATTALMGDGGGSIVFIGSQTQRLSAVRARSRPRTRRRRARCTRRCSIWPRSSARGGSG